MSQSTTFICDRCGQKETDLIIVGRDWRVICRPRLRSDSGVVALDLCQDCAAFFDVWMKEKRNIPLEAAPEPPVENPNTKGLGSNQRMG